MNFSVLIVAALVLLVLTAAAILVAVVLTTMRRPERSAHLQSVERLESLEFELNDQPEVREDQQE